MLKRHGLKKGLSLVLVFCLILSLMPTVAMAQEPTAAAGTETTVDVTDGETPAGTETGDTTGTETGDTTGTETGDTTGTEGGSIVDDDGTLNDEIKDTVDDVLKPIPGEKTPEEIAAEEAAKKAEEEAAAQAAAEEAARLEAERLAAEQARAEELANVLDVGDKKEPRDTSNDGFYRVVHLDAGRKYFTPNDIKTLIDNAADAGYNQLELYLSDNEGFRFALDDMEISTEYDTYDLSDALSAGECLNQTEMSDLIDYAKEKGVEIVPCINTPGHMGAILDAFPDFRYSGSETSIDLTDPEAVAFALAIVEKYADYFASEGCDFFNIGADEYANDMDTMGFAGLYWNGGYQDFVNYLNAAAQVVINEGMTPRAFNDGIYYNDDTDYGVNDAIQVCYWSSGWWGYDVASAKTIRDMGHEMINTHGDYYWVLGKNQCTVEKASEFDYTNFSGNSKISDASGAMFCIWCDYPNADSAENVIADTADVLEAFGFTLPQEEAYEGETVYPVGEDGKEISNISVTAPGLTGVTVTDVTESAELTMDSDVAAYMAYDIRPETAEGAYGDEAQVMLPVPENWKPENVRGFVQETGGSITIIEGKYQNGTYTFVMPHFSVGGVLLLETKDIQDKGNITVSVDGKQTEYLYQLPTDPENFTVEYDPAGVVNVSIGSTHHNAQGPETVPALGDETSLAGNGEYVIASNGQLLVYNNGTVSAATLPAHGEQIDESMIWTITKSGNEYTISNGGYYLTADDGGNLSLSRRSATWKHDDNGFYQTKRFLFWSEDYYLTYSNSWKADSNGKNSLYSVGTTTIGGTSENWDATITFTGKTVGEADVLIDGQYLYHVTVTDVDLSEVTPLQLQYWITNGRGTGGDGNTYKVVSAEDAYSESGVDVTKFAPTTTTKEGRTIQYWRCRLLDTTKQNNSTSGTEEQTGAAGDDETYNGTGFTKIRYWDGQWSVYTEDGDWVNVESKHQLVAYYLEILPVADELTVNAADWGKKGDGSVSGDYLDPSAVCTVSVQVIYEDGTTNPKSTTATDLKSRTIAYGYWATGRGIGTLNLSGLEGYQIWKVEAETGSMSGYGDTWGSYTVNRFTWDDNAVTVYEGDPVDSYVIHNDANNPNRTGIYRNLMWDENNEAILIKVYVKAPVTEDSLTVHYVDRTAGNKEFYSYNINVAEGTVFDPGFALVGENTLTNNTVINIKEVPQEVTAELSKLTEIGEQYRFSDYTCVQVVRSENGKEVTLYYTFSNTKDFVVDFGLPVDITFAQLGIQDATTGTVEGAEYGSASVTNGVLHYVPTTVLKETETLQLTVNSATHTIYLYPATTVYYEQGFADYDGWTDATDYTGNGLTQVAELAGSAENPYGYDPAYNSAPESVAKSENEKDTATFSFKGTGVDIYAKCAPDTGVVMIQVESDAGTVKKTLVVDTAMKIGNTDVTAGQAVTANSIPIVSLDGLPYTEYTVTITHVKRSDNDTDVDPVYLDGFRVHGTMGDNADDVYAKDNEADPTIRELRDAVLKVQLDATDATSASNSYKMQIAKAAKSQIYSAVILSDAKYQTSLDIVAQDLLDNGPKNELYLAPGETLVFKVDGVSGKNVQVGLKNLTAGAACSVNGMMVNSSTDMFYKVETDGYVTIQNTGTGILAVTELKVAGK